MTFDLTPTAAQHDLARRTHEFAESVIRPVARDYDQRQEFPWPVLEEAARRGFYSPLFYRDLIGDPTGMSLPIFMEELFWGCAGIGLAIVMPALALSAIGQAASPEQILQWAPECFGTPGDLKLAALAISEPEGGSDVRNLRTHARRDGGDWIIDGHKMGSETVALPTCTWSMRWSTRSSVTAVRRCLWCRAVRRGWKWCANSTS
jgi:acyl-CoA dehydrogenase